MIGLKVNNYELTRLLGEGGMGAVYVGEHPMLGRKVAVKVLRRELIRDKEQVTRFINEARATDAIAHPNIVQVLDVGVLPDGLPYILMELLLGQTLGARMQSVGPLPLATALAIARQAASAIAAAHAAGIVHRDLKPDNLFLVAENATATGAPPGERVKVLDFGIAKLKAGFSGADLRTKTGSVMGTPAYMSPEQCLGRSGEIDHRTDVYALGVIMFEMLCGTAPFLGEGFGEVLVKHVTEAPAAPTSLNPAIPAAVEQLILRAMAKNKEERWESMQVFEQAIAAAAAAPSATPGASARAETAPPAPRAAPTRSTSTTFSTAAGAIESFSSDLALLRPARSRWGLIGAGVVIAAALAAGVVLRNGRPAAPGPGPSSAAPSPQPASTGAPMVPAPSPALLPPAPVPVAAPAEPRAAPAEPNPAQANDGPGALDRTRTTRPPKTNRSNKSAPRRPTPARPGARPPELLPPALAPPTAEPAPVPVPPPAPQRLEKL